jgi:hypothetical protein
MQLYYFYSLQLRINLIISINLPSFLFETKTQNVHLTICHVLLGLDRYLTALEAESALRRSRVEAELAASRTAAEIALRRSRLEADAYVEKATKDDALRRSRVQADLARETANEKRERLERELEEEHHAR